MMIQHAFAAWVDRLTGDRHSFAVDYAAYWTEGGRAPRIADYNIQPATGHAIMQRVQTFCRAEELAVKAAEYYDKAIAEGRF